MEIDRVYNRDCIEGMREMEENSVDLVVTSPPYNVGIPYDIYDDTLPWAEYYRWCASWLTEVHRVLKPDGRLCLNHYFSLGSGKCRTAPLMVLNGIAQEVGLSHKSVAIWYDSHRPKCTAWGSWLSASAPYITSPAEGILFLYKDTWKKQRPGKSTIEKEEFLEAISGIWKIRPESKPWTKANFPVEIPLRCIRLLSYEGDLVLDPFMGAGTTAVAALLERRHYLGFELSPAYCAIAQTRVAEVASLRSLKAVETTDPPVKSISP